MIAAAGRPIPAICWMLSFAPSRTMPNRRSVSAATFSPGPSAAPRMKGSRPTTIPSRIATVTSEMTGGRNVVARRATAAIATAATIPGASLRRVVRAALAPLPGPRSAPTVE
jgi:hypothetical protein